MPPPTGRGPAPGSTLLTGERQQTAPPGRGRQRRGGCKGVAARAHASTNSGTSRHWMASRHPRPGHRRRRILPPMRTGPDTTSHPPHCLESTTVLTALAAWRDDGRPPLVGAARWPSSGTASTGSPHGTAAAAHPRRSRWLAALPRRSAVANRPRRPSQQRHAGSGASSVPHGWYSPAASALPSPSTWCCPTTQGGHRTALNPQRRQAESPSERRASLVRSPEPSRPQTKNRLGDGYEASVCAATAALQNEAQARPPA